MHRASMHDEREITDKNIKFETLLLCPNIGPTQGSLTSDPVVMHFTI